MLLITSGHPICKHCRAGGSATRPAVPHQPRNRLVAVCLVLAPATRSAGSGRAHVSTSERARGRRLHSLVGHVNTVEIAREVVCVSIMRRVTTPLSICIALCACGDNEIDPPDAAVLPPFVPAPHVLMPS